MSNWAGGCRIYHKNMARPLMSAVLLMLLAVPPALGADEDLTQIVVPYGDLDLHSATDQSELHARLVNAASTLCHPRWMRTTPDSEFSAHYREVIYHACMGRLINRALARVEDAREARMVALN
jgi:UrcA family protein